MSPVYTSRSPPRDTTTPVTVRPEASVSSLVTSAPQSSVTFVTAEDGPDRDHLGVGLGVHQARVAITPGAADAGAARPVGLVQQDPARRVERVPAALGQVVGDLLDPRLMRDRRPRVLLRPVALGRVLAVVAVHLVQLLGLRVPRLEVVVGQRPGRGEPVDVLDLAEVLRAAAGTAPRRRTWWPRRRSSGPGAGTICRRASYQVSLEMYLPVTNTGSGFQLSISRGRKSPRSSSRIRLPESARACARVPPPAPVPDDDDVIVLAHAPTIAA